MTTRNIAIALGMTILALLCWYFSDILSYLLLAWVLSMVGEPIMDFFQKKVKIKSWRMGASTAAILTILTFFLAFGLILVIFVPSIVEQGRHLTELNYQEIGQKLESPLQNANDQLHKTGILRGEETLASKVEESLKKYFSPTLISDYLRGALATAGNVVVTFTSTIFILFFFLKEKHLFTGVLHALVPTKMEDKIGHAVEESKVMLTRYFGGLLLQMFGFFAMVSLLLWLMGVQNALLIGSFGGLVNVIPYVGPILGFVFGAFITISSSFDGDFYGQVLPLLLKVGVAFGVAQSIDNLLLQPMIFSKSVAAHPLEIFIVIMVGAKLGGVLGMVLAIPAYTVARVIARTFFNEFKLVQKITNRLDE